MRFWRRCVADPWSGGLIAATVALFVALQGLAGGYLTASGASHQSVVDGFVVCEMTGARLALADPDNPAPVDDGSHLCCCSLGILTPQGKLLPAVLSAAAPLVIAPASGPRMWSPRPREHAPAVRRMAIAAPRAPPLLSV